MKTKAKANSFVITIMNTDDDSWQGELIWIDEDKREGFRSSLEMIRLIDSARTQAEKDS